MTNEKNAQEFRGQHVVVTGGATGIGAAIASAFIESGASVTIMGRTESRLQAFADQNQCNFVVVDVSDEASVSNAFKAATSESGPVAILVNNAGIAEAEPFKKMTTGFWRKIMAVNLDGVFYCSREAVPGMLAADDGRIINIASTAALRGYAYVSAYSASKHAVLGLTRSLALEFAHTGITVNAVCPGYTDTDVVARSIDEIAKKTGRSHDEARAELVKSNPQGRLISPEEVANTVLWLAGGESRSITGQAIAVAGGEVS